MEKKVEEKEEESEKMIFLWLAGILITAAGGAGARFFSGTLTLISVISVIFGGLLIAVSSVLLDGNEASCESIMKNVLIAMIMAFIIIFGLL